MERLGGSCELIDQLVDFFAEFVLEVTRYLTSHRHDGFLDFLIVALSLYLVLDRQYLIQNVFHIVLGFSLFLCRYSNIAVLKEVG
jgi:uncharacterized protein YebE (UPF0316 family)